MKAGLMEIADVFAVNKSDRPDADAFVRNLRLMLAPAFHQQKNEIKIIKTVASAGTGVSDLYKAIQTPRQPSVEVYTVWKSRTSPAFAALAAPRRSRL